MARLQILPLPTAPGDDRPPFALIIDQAPRDESSPAFREDVTNNAIAAGIGALHVLVFEDTIDIPANEPPPLPDADDSERAGTTQIVYAHERTRLDLCNALLLSGDTTWRQLVEQAAQRQQVASESYRMLAEIAELLEQSDVSEWGDIRAAVEDYRTLRRVAERDAKRCEELRAESLRRGKVKLEYAERIRELENELAEARQWARHGYEIGQRHCGWTDHGVAPGWLTEGWPNSFDSCEHLKQAAEYDTALGHVLEVAADLEAAEAHGGAWDANQQAARRIRVAVGRPRAEEASGL